MLKYIVVIVTTLILAVLNFSESRSTLNLYLETFDPAATPSGISLLDQQIQADKLNVKFSARTPALDYGNIFQTSDKSGLRLEFQPQQGLVLVVGLDQLQVIDPKPPLNVWRQYDFSINSESFVLKIDGARAFESTNGALIRNARQIDAVYVGNGFAHQRQFSGEIRNFSLDASVVGNPSSLIPLLWSAIAAIVSITLYALGYTFFRSNSLIPGVRSSKDTILFVGIALGTGLAMARRDIWTTPDIEVLLALMALSVSTIGAVFQRKRGDWLAWLYPALAVLIAGVAILYRHNVANEAVAAKHLAPLIAFSFPLCVSGALNAFNPENRLGWRQMPLAAFSIFALTLAIGYTLKDTSVYIVILALGALVWRDWEYLGDVFAGLENSVLAHVVCTAGVLFWLLLGIHSAVLPFTFRSYYALIVATGILGFSGWYMFVRRPQNRLYAIFAPILLFNLGVLTLSALSKNDFVLLSIDFHISFIRENFADFFAMITDQASGAYNWVISGQGPFLFAAAKIIGFLGGVDADHAFLMTSRLQPVYIGFLALCLAPFILMLIRTSRTLEHGEKTPWPSILFFLSSYPVLIAIERGNFVLLSAGVLSAAVFAYWDGRPKTAAALFGILFSIKVLNVVFLPFVLYNLRGHWRVTFASFMAATLGSLIFLVGFDFAAWFKFGSAILAPFGGLLGAHDTPVETDWGKIAGGTTSLDAYRALLRTLVLMVQGEAISDIGFLNLFLMALSACIAVYFYLRVRKGSTWNHELMVLTLAPMLSHPASGSYNLLLLITVMLPLLSSPMTLQNARLFTALGLVMSLNSGFVLFGLQLTGPTDISPVTTMAFLMPASLLIMMVTLVFENAGNPQTEAASVQAA